MGSIRARLRPVPMLEIALSLSACAPRTTVAPPPPPPSVEIAAVAAPIQEEREEDAAVTTIDVPAVTLDDVWSTTKTSDVPHAQALAQARSSRARVLDALRTADAGAGMTPAWFERVHVGAESTSRWFATAFHAADATPAQKIATALAGAESALDLASRLDALGLTQLPRTWRADPSLALTFEDVSAGPAKRWRDEGLALVQLCIEAAYDLGVEDASTATCKATRTRMGRVAVRRAFARDAGERGCRCHPGDPLCSESAGQRGWCTHD